jgi:hypothetical protein
MAMPPGRVVMTFGALLAPQQLAFTPALPKVGSTAKVKPTITIKGAKLSGCKGGGVTSGTFAATLKFSVASNCQTLLKGAETGTKGTETITWNTKKTSTVALALKGVKGKVTQTTATGPVAKGLFAKAKQSGTLNYTLPKGACGTAGLSKVTFKNVTPIVIK